MYVYMCIYMYIYREFTPFYSILIGLLLERVDMQTKHQFKIVFWLNNIPDTKIVSFHRLTGKLISTRNSAIMNMYCNTNVYGDYCSINGKCKYFIYIFAFNAIYLKINYIFFFIQPLKIIFTINVLIFTVWYLYKYTYILKHNFWSMLFYFIFLTVNMQLQFSNEKFYSVNDRRRKKFEYILIVYFFF